MRSSTASRAVRNSTGTSGLVAAQPAQHLEAVDVGQHDVEHHGVGPELARPRGPRTSRRAAVRTSQPS